MTIAAPAQKWLRIAFWTYMCLPGSWIQKKRFSDSFSASTHFWAWLCFGWDSFTALLLCGCHVTSTFQKLPQEWVAPQVCAAGTEWYREEGASSPHQHVSETSSEEKSWIMKCLLSEEWIMHRMPPLRIALNYEMSLVLEARTTPSMQALHNWKLESECQSQTQK